VPIYRHGARLLRAYLHMQPTTLSVAGLAARCGVSRAYLSRLLSGDRYTVSVDVAHAIQVATQGAVPIARWARDWRPVGAAVAEAP
jgi:transcriptional regulator with XRE-family HTH domain